MHGQDETEWSSNTHQDHHDVHGNADIARVVDVVVLDVTALVGQEQAKDHQQALVHVQRTNQVRVVVALTHFIDIQQIFGIVLGGYEN